VHHDELRDVLKFLIPLMKPNKPSRLNVGPVATIADCLFGNLKVSWAAVFYEALEKELDKMESHLDSFLPANMIHLYQDKKALTKEEERRFTAMKWTLMIEDLESEEEEEEQPAKLGYYRGIQRP
jgi:hypothetical protein